MRAVEIAQSAGAQVRVPWMEVGSFYQITTGRSFFSRAEVVCKENGCIFLMYYILVRKGRKKVTKRQFEKVPIKTILDARRYEA